MANAYDKEEFMEKLKEYSSNLDKMRDEIHKVVVGQDDIITAMFHSIICNGHVLLEGVPGLAKTLLIMALSKTVSNVKFQRIQFTPDLLPADLTGITAYNPEKGFYTVKGPIFANFILADEINRAPPKVQSAMLSVMQERQVIIGKETFALPSPFLVLATQNPLEQMGTYPLPEAQIDRFLFKVFVDYPDKKSERILLETNTTTREFSEYDIRPVIAPEFIFNMQRDVQKIYVSPEIRQYIVELIHASRNPEQYGLKYGQYIEWGGSPRASIALFIAGKSMALIHGKDYVTPNNIKEIAYNVLRHRVLLNYEGKALEISSDCIITDLLKHVPVP